jgi:hypothetical protein
LCINGTYDCDSIALNGCESSVPCCSIGTDCSGYMNVANYSCNGGRCGILACRSGYADCNGLLSDGCETNVAATVAACGSCSTDCSKRGLPGVAAFSCTNGQCGIAQCLAGFNSCDNTSTSGCESDSQRDASASFAPSQPSPFSSFLSLLSSLSV